MTKIYTVTLEQQNYIRRILSGEVMFRKDDAEFYVKCTIKSGHKKFEKSVH